MNSLIALSAEDVEQIDVEIQSIYDSTGREIRETVALLVKHSHEEFGERFYNSMLNNPQARFFLDHKVVNERLHASFSQWLFDLFNLEPVNGQSVRMRQMEVGAVHARIRVPVSLVMRGFRDLKRQMIEALSRTRSTPEQVGQAANFISAVFDISLAVMTSAYIRHSERGVRTEEALRLFSVTQDLATERERQRASLSEWAQNVFLTTQLKGGLESTCPLGQSDFGLWFAYRANLLFGRSSEYGVIGQLLARCDEHLAKLKKARTPKVRVEILLKMKIQLDNILVLINNLYDDIGREEVSKDSLTKIFNRRFLPTIISRQIETHKQNDETFTICIFEIAHHEKLRKIVNQQDMDLFIQRCAQFLVDSARSSDAVFRISDSRFLVVRVESVGPEGQRYARGVVQGFKALHFEFERGDVANLSLLYSVTEYDGHPDPRYVIRAAESAAMNEA